MDNQTEGQNSEFKIRVKGIPENGAKSRVETQIKLTISLESEENNKPPNWSYLRIPDHLLAGSKLRKSQQQKLLDGSTAAMVSDESKVVTLEARVICESDESKIIKMCQGCVRRERKRAERKKDAKSSLYQLNMTSVLDKAFERDRQRVLLFNCDPLVHFSSGEAILPTRITCYCRHHNERIGFRVRFIMRDDKGIIVAMGESPPIMITDDHKSSTITTTTTVKPPQSRKRRRVSSFYHDTTPMSSRTNSICESESSDSFTTMTPFLIDQQLTPQHECLSPKTPTSLDPFHPMFVPDDTFNSFPQQDFFNQNNYFYNDVLPETCSPSSLSLIPILDDIIPASGSSIGGIQVTLTGQHFHRGLTVMFGNRAATMVSCTSQTIVCILPVAEEPSGTVVISFKEHALMRASPLPPVFHYEYLKDGTSTPFSTETDEGGHNLLHLAAYKNDAHLATLLVSRLPELAHGQDNNGLTPLQLACLMKSTVVADTLSKATMFQKHHFDLPLVFQNDSLLYHM